MQAPLSIFNRAQLVKPLVSICQRAGQQICQIYHSSERVVIEEKQDNSPITQADRRSQQIIADGLASLSCSYPVLSEEGQIPSFSIRKQWPYYWLVDPLDGTREFIERTGEFTINIALIESGAPTLGVIYVPLNDLAYVGVVGQGAWLISATGQQQIQVACQRRMDRIRVLTSRRHSGVKLDECLRKLEQYFDVVERVYLGSALKFCYIAQGFADIYPRFSPCSEWDTAAGQALLEAAGGQLVNVRRHPLVYNQCESLITPDFYALGGVQVGLVTKLLG